MLPIIILLLLIAYSLLVRKPYKKLLNDYQYHVLVDVQPPKKLLSNLRLIERGMVLLALLLLIATYCFLFNLKNN